MSFTLHSRTCTLALSPCNKMKTVTPVENIKNPSVYACAFIIAIIGVRCARGKRDSGADRKGERVTKMQLFVGGETRHE